MNDRLKNNLDKLKQNNNTKDEDATIVVDAVCEGAGKSTVGMQIAYYYDNTFNLSRVCMDADEFADAIDKAEKGQAIVFDEGFRGLSSRTAMSAVNGVLVRKMMEMRQKNLFCIIILPTFFMLDKYVALYRSKCLIHVYKYKGKKGFFRVYNRQKKKILYLIGKKLMDYSKPKTNYTGQFPNQYVVDETAYRLKKLKSLNDTPVGDEPKYLAQRNVAVMLLYYAYKKLGKSQENVSKDLARFDFKINRQEVSNIVAKCRKTAIRQRQNITYNLTEEKDCAAVGQEDTV